MTTNRTDDQAGESMGHLSPETLGDFAEGRLSEREQAAASEHLAACPQCRSEITWIRSLREQVRELPTEAEAPRDGWPAIEQRIRSGSRPPLDELSVARKARREGKGATAQPRPAFASHGAALRRIAAILLLMGLPAGATWWIMRPAADSPEGPIPGAEQAAGEPAAGEPPAGEAGPTGGSTIAGDLRFAAQTPEMVAQAYEPAIRELRAVLEANRAQLQPETIAVLEENLRIIDAAIQDFYEALEADPANLDTARLLNGMYETKIQFLRQAARLTREA